MSKLNICAILAIASFSTVSLANVVSLPTGVEVNASISFDEINSQLFDTQQADSFGLGIASSDVDNAVVTGSNPIAGSMLSALFIDSALSAQNSEIDFEYVSYFFDVTLTNSLLSDSVEFLFDFEFMQQVNATANENIGADAFADSTLSIVDNNNAELLFSSVLSDLNNGPVSFSDQFDFSFILAPSESLTFSGMFEANLFSFDESAFSVLTEGQLSLSAVNVIGDNVAVSAPSGFYVLLIASMAVLVRRVKKPQL